MLTRLEVDGFKNLLNFEMDLGPFNCIAGTNGVGNTWRTRSGERGVDKGTILAYLTAPPNANLRLAFDWNSVN